MIHCVVYAINSVMLILLYVEWTLYKEDDDTWANICASLINESISLWPKYTILSATSKQTLNINMNSERAHTHNYARKQTNKRTIYLTFLKHVELIVCGWILKWWCARFNVWKCNFQVYTGESYSEHRKWLW